jgi:hypothetical protein
MRASPTTTALTAACATLLLAACDEPSTSPARRLEANAAPTTARREAPVALSDVALPTATPFTIRATLDPFFINQAPDFMIRSHVRADLVIQRLVSPPGEDVWHTHPGPSFGIVEQGQVMLTRYEKGRCTSEVYGPGVAYYEVADQVHRVTVLGATPAVEYKVRFNNPVGAPTRTVVGDPGCGAAGRGTRGTP